MSDVSWIGRQTKKGAEYIYCHHDGSMHHTGKILYNHYSIDNRVKTLIESGDAIYIESTIEDSAFYHRDKGQSLEKAILTTKSNSRPISADPFHHCYLWKDNKWWISGRYFSDWIELEELMD